MKKLLYWFLGITLSILLSLLLLLAIVTVFAIPVELTRFKEPLEDVVSRLLSRPVTIEGPVVVTTSLKPSFVLKGLHIQNPENFTQKNFLLMKEVHLQVSVLPLLSKKIHIPELKVHGLTVTLEENQQGEVNWLFASNRSKGLQKSAKNTDNSQAAEIKNSSPATNDRSPVAIVNDTIVMQHIDLQNINVIFLGKDRTKPVTFLLSKCSGAMDVGQPMRLDINGKAGTFSYALDVSLASLEEFLTENKTWVDMQLDIAKTTFKLSGNLDLEKAAKSLTLSASITGENLANLNRLSGIDLPPFAPYQLHTQLHLQANVAELQKLEIKTGGSSLIGNARLEKSDTVMASVDLRSPLIQLDDFLFEKWSWTAHDKAPAKGETGESKEENGEPPAESKQDRGENKKLIDPQVLERFDCDLNVVADKVQSGKDMLGGGRLAATLQEGRIKVAPLVVELPGGKINMSASLKPGDEKAEGSLKLFIENFDIGILVRRKQPDSDMGGLVNLDIDLHSSASSVTELMGAGTGYFDFSGNLTNFKAGLIDLWAVNLISAIVSSTKENQSQVNCAVGRWSAHDGQLTSDAFFIDTSKIRICAKGYVNLRDERLQIKVTPKAKKAEFFSLATPIKLEGSFSDLRVKLRGGGALCTAVKVIASPVTTPLKRLFNDKLPRDGADVCTMKLGPDKRQEVIVPGCR